MSTIVVDQLFVDKLFKCCEEGDICMFLKLWETKQCDVQSVKNINGVTLAAAVVGSQNLDGISSFLSFPSLSYVNASKLLPAACQTGNSDIVRFVYSRVQRYEEADILSALNICCSSGNTAIMELLLSLASVSLLDLATHLSPHLLDACKNGHLHIVQLLLDAGVCSISRDEVPFSSSARDQLKCISNYKDCFEACYNAGALSTYTHTDLIYTASHVGSVPVVRHTLAVAAADHLVSFENVRYALEVCAYQGNVEIAAVLLDHLNDHEITVEQKQLTILMCRALSSGNEAVADFLISKKASIYKYQEDGSTGTTLMAAAQGNCVNTMKTLLNSSTTGCKEYVNLLDDDNNSALAYAHSPEIVKMLLHKGAEVNPEHCVTVLLGACQRLCPEAVEMLLAAGANSAEAALVKALSAEPTEEPTQKVKIVEILLKADSTRYHIYKYRLHICAMCRDDTSEQITKALIQDDASLIEGYCCWYDSTPLVSAMIFANVSVFDTLIACGANINAIDQTKRSVLSRLWHANMQSIQ